MLPYGSETGRPPDTGHDILVNHVYSVTDDFTKHKQMRQEGGFHMTSAMKADSWRGQTY